MTKPIKNTSTDFEHVILLITEARNRVYSKANAELVMLYFNVGEIVSAKVANGNWGDGTVNDLAKYIAEKQPLLKGFNRRGLYRMKQFYEVYSDDAFVSALLTQLEKEEKPFVSPVLTQLQGIDKEVVKFVSSVLTQISWTTHLYLPETYHQL